MMYIMTKKGVSPGPTFILLTPEGNRALFSHRAGVAADIEYAILA